MVLKISLKPGERAAINGAVIVNGDRRTNFVVENKARVLRERDIMQPDEANSPAKRIYLAIMMMYLDPECRDEMMAEYEKRLTEFVDAISTPEALSVCSTLGASVANREFYKAMTACRALIDFETERLSHVA